MRGVQKPDHMSLNTLILRLKEGRYVIPDFQREFEWQPWDINALLRSVFLDYYVGSLLLWKGKKESFDALSCEVLYGFDSQTRPHPWDYDGCSADSIVLDGQQRLTALYYVFIAPDVPLPDRANRAVFFVHVDKFMDEQYDEAFRYDWLSRRFGKLLKNRELQYADHIFPLSVLGAGGWDLYEWVTGYEDYWKRAVAEAEADGIAASVDSARRHAEDAKAFGEYLKSIMDQYQIAYIELDRDLAVDKVCDIFTQINSKGVRLDVFDLVNALLKPKGLQLKHMWRAAAPRLEFVDTRKMNVYVLQVMSILRQSYCSPKYLYYLLPGQEKTIRTPEGELQREILIRDTTDFESHWNRAVDALEYGINLLKHPQEFGAISSQYLPYVTVIPVFSAIQAVCKALPAADRLDAQRKIRHWYWASVFTNRYSGAVESTAARDFIDLKAWMADEDAQPAMLQEFRDHFRGLELRKETKKGTSVYNGIFNLLVLQGARDWMTGTLPMHDDLDDHHIVPSSRAAGRLDGINVHTILNRTPLTIDTNRQVIGDRLPNEYLPDMIARNGEDQVQAILESHFISPPALSILLREPFGADDYDEFISERQRTILDAIEDLLIKGRLDLAPRLRDLDQSIERVELSLRRVIAQVLHDSPEELPPHINQKLDEAISKAAKKNAAIDPTNFEALADKLQYADLRELQETITSKTTWQRFEPRFSNKETLNWKFGQLSELRNSIRHSRAVDEVTRMEGEAAIVWFEKVLSK